MVGVPANVEQATTTALRPWRIDIETLPADPGLLQGAPEERATALAAGRDVAAVIWLDTSGSPPVLRLYDVERAQVMTRPLSSGPPFSEPAAASVALSIKTLLRNSRLGARMSAAGLSPSSDVLAFGLGVSSEVRVRADRDQDPEPRIGLGLLWAPSAIGGAYTLAATLDMGRGESIHHHGFVGEFTDIVLGVELRRRVRATPRLELAGLVAAALHRTRMRGLVARDGRTIEISRLNPSASAGLAVRMPIIARLCGDLRIAGTYFPLRQSYVLYDRQLLQTPRVAVELGIGVTVPLSW